MVVATQSAAITLSCNNSATGAVDYHIGSWLLITITAVSVPFALFTLLLRPITTEVWSVMAATTSRGC